MGKPIEPIEKGNETRKEEKKDDTLIDRLMEARGSQSNDSKVVRYRPVNGKQSQRRDAVFKND